MLILLAASLSRSRGSEECLSLVRRYHMRYMHAWGQLMCPGPGTVAIEAAEVSPQLCIPA